MTPTVAALSPVRIVALALAVALLGGCAPGGAARVRATDGPPPASRSAPAVPSRTAQPDASAPDDTAPPFGDPALGEGLDISSVLTPEQLATMRGDPSADGAITAAVTYLSVWRTALGTADPAALARMSLPGCRWCEAVTASLTAPAPDGAVYLLRVWPMTAPTGGTAPLDVGGRATVRVGFELTQATTAVEGQTQYLHMTGSDRYLVDIGMQRTPDGWSVYGGDARTWE
jgi:hypothetical protein